METSEFDKFAAEYCSLHAKNIGISGERPEYFAEYKIVDLAREYRSRHANPSPAILDFGAGVGTSVPFFQKHLPGARVACIDVSEKSLQLGERRFPSQARFLHFDGRRIPFADSTVDIVFAACVLHHIAHDEHAALFSEFRRVLVGGGMALVYEHNPLNPLTVHAVNTCPFDENAHLIGASSIASRIKVAGFAEAKVRYRVFFPRFMRALRILERWMTWLPLGAQYYVVAVK